MLPPLPYLIPPVNMFALKTSKLVSLFSICHRSTKITVFRNFLLRRIIILLSLFSFPNNKMKMFPTFWKQENNDGLSQNEI